VLLFFPQLMTMPPRRASGWWRAGEGVVLSEMIMAKTSASSARRFSLERLKQMDATPVGDHVTALHFAKTGKPRASIFDEPAKLDFASVRSGLSAGSARWASTSGPHGMCGSVRSSRPHRSPGDAGGVEIPILGWCRTSRSWHPRRRAAGAAYGKDVWGVHARMGYYARPPTPGCRAAAIAYNLFFAAGASIFTECNMPLRVTGSCAAFFGIQAGPPIRAGRAERLTFDDPICAAAREVVADHFRFTQFHQRPAAHPRVKMGFHRRPPRHRQRADVVRGSARLPRAGRREDVEAL